MSEAGQRRRLWISVGEGAAIIAVLISALSFWDAHRERTIAKQEATSQAQAASALVLTGAAEDGGRRLALAPLMSSQAIQSQKYFFPTILHDGPVTLSAARPRVQLDWIAGGLGRTLDAAHAKASGEGVLPVAMLTTYVEQGEMHADRSLYRIGYSWRPRFLFGRAITLEGLSLVGRGVTGDPQAQVERLWAEDRHIAPAGG